jgi:hypothetical protein
MHDRRCIGCLAAEPCVLLKHQTAWQPGSCLVHQRICEGCIALQLRRAHISMGAEPALDIAVFALSGSQLFRKFGNKCTSISYHRDDFSSDALPWLSHRKRALLATHGLPTMRSDRASATSSERCSTQRVIGVHASCTTVMDDLDALPVSAAAGHLDKTSAVSFHALRARAYSPYQIPERMRATTQKRRVCANTTAGACFSQVSSPPWLCLVSYRDPLTSLDSSARYALDVPDY